jgi:hypothetical protein
MHYYGMEAAGGVGEPARFEPSGRRAFHRAREDHRNPGLRPGIARDRSAPQFGTRRPNRQAPFPPFFCTVVLARSVARAIVKVV